MIAKRLAIAFVALACLLNANSDFIVAWVEILGTEEVDALFWAIIYGTMLVGACTELEEI